MKISTEIYEDESAVNRYFLSVDDSAYTTNMFDELKQRAAESGYAVEDYSDEGRVGIVMTEKFNNLEELMSIFPARHIDPNPSLLRFNVRKTSSLLKRKYFVEIQVDTLQLVEGGMFDRSALSQLDLRYSITLPGKIIAHNGTQIDDNSVTWEMGPASNNIYILEARSESGMNLPINPFVGIFLLSVCGIITITISGIGVKVSLEQRRKQTGI